MYWFAATRQASIVVARTWPGSSDWSPQSPNATVLPRTALPLIRPLWLLRYLTRFGMSAIASLLSGIITEIDPHLHADRADRRLGDGKAVIDVPLQRRQGDRTSNCFLLPRHLGAPQAPRQLDFDAVSSGIHHLIQRALERPPKTSPLHQLLGHVFRNEHGTAMGVVDLDNFQFHSAAGQVLEFRLQTVDFLSFAADDDSRPGRVEMDDDLVPRPLDFDFRNAGKLILRFHEVADFEVLDQEVAILFLAGKPTAPPGFNDTDAIAGRIYFLSHRLVLVTLVGRPVFGRVLFATFRL